MTTPTTVIIQSAVGWHMRGVATATNSLMRSLGQTVGVAVFGTLFNRAVVDSSPNHIAIGIHVVFIVIFIFAVLNLIALLFLPSHQKIVAQQVG
jgi:hypothetical protein